MEEGLAIRLLVALLQSLPFSAAAYNHGVIRPREDVVFGGNFCTEISILVMRWTGFAAEAMQ